MINRAGKLRAMKPMESGMNVPEPTPARNCIPKNGVRFGDIGARRLEVKKDHDANEKDPANPQDAAEVGTTHANEHLSDAETCRHPSSLVEADMEPASQVGQPEGGDPGAQGRHDGSQKHAYDADVGAPRVDAQALTFRAHRVQDAPNGGDWRGMRGHGTARSEAPLARASVLMVATTDIPGLTRLPSAGFFSSMILTGTRWTTFVKLPVALSGGNKAKMLPVPGDHVSTRPSKVTSGKASTVTRTAWPTRTLVICVSLKFPMTHTFGSGTTVINCVPTLTNWPGRTWRWPTMPSAGETIVE